jgi:hypothetical protein
MPWNSFVQSFCSRIPKSPLKELFFAFLGMVASISRAVEARKVFVFTTEVTESTEGSNAEAWEPSASRGYRAVGAAGRLGRQRR